LVLVAIKPSAFPFARVKEEEKKKRKREREREREGREQFPGRIMPFVHHTRRKQYPGEILASASTTRSIISLEKKRRKKKKKKRSGRGGRFVAEIDGAFRATLRVILRGFGRKCNFTRDTRDPRCRRARRQLHMDERRVSGRVAPMLIAVGIRADGCVAWQLGYVTQ